jgi:hypothetical protein
MQSARSSLLTCERPKAFVGQALVADSVRTVFVQDAPDCERIREQLADVPSRAFAVDRKEASGVEKHIPV